MPAPIARAPARGRHLPPTAHASRNPAKHHRARPWMALAAGSGRGRAPSTSPEASVSRGVGVAVGAAPAAPERVHTHAAACIQHRHELVDCRLLVLLEQADLGTVRIRQTRWASQSPCKRRLMPLLIGAVGRSRSSSSSSSSGRAHVLVFLLVLFARATRGRRRRAGVPRVRGVAGGTASGAGRLAAAGGRSGLLAGRRAEVRR